MSDIQHADDLAAMIGESVGQVFGDLVTPDLILGAEKGEWPERLWATAIDSGFDRALVPESAGGIAASWAGALPILRGIGQWQVPLPLAESMVGRFLAAVAGIELPEGPVTIAVPGRGDTLAMRGDRIEGTVSGVAWAGQCRALIVPDPATAGRIAVIELGGSGVSITAGANSAGEPRDRVVLAGVARRTGEVSALSGLDDPVRALGAFARSAALSGALASVLDQSVQYANDRVQFGRQIGKFQAIQQQLALIAGEVTAARMAVDAAARTLPCFDAASGALATDDRALFDLAVAKVRTGDAATVVAPIAHAVHGAIGFTHEHRLHLATRRLWSWRGEFGSDAQWADVLGQAMVAAGGGFWEMIAARRLER